jgi:Nucleotidyl transferase AbiEii toxin, Type IV TA system
MSVFTPLLNTFPPPQRALWPELKAIPDWFVLYGGTAIALRLGHRVSIDFDFFSSEHFRCERLLDRMPFLAGGVVAQRKDDTLTCSLQREGGEVSVSFFGGLDFNRVRDPDRTDDTRVAVASLIDLMATKLKVLWQRASLKDYQDIDAVLNSGVDLATGLAAAKAVYGRKFDPSISLRALTFFGDVQGLCEDARKRLTKAAAAVDLSGLPKLTAQRGLARGGMSR